jgi:invasion protein IalB
MPQFLGAIQKYPLAAAVVLLVVVIGVGAGGYLLGQRETRSVVTASTLAPVAPKGLPQGWKQMPARQFDSWQLMCVRDAKAATHCDLVLRAINKNTKQMIFGLVITQVAPAQPVLAVLTPPHVLLTKGVQLSVHGTQLPVFPFVGCNGRVCRAAKALDKPTVDTLLGADSVRVQFSAAGGRDLGFDVPVTGLAGGYAALQVEMSPEAPK